MATGLITSTAASAVIGTDEGANAAYAFAARIQVGDELPGQACSGALVAPQWVITSKECLTPEPPETRPVPPGPPRLEDAITVTVGRTDLSTTTSGAVRTSPWVIPHPDRNVALIRLATPVRGVPVLPIATTAPQNGEQLRVLGFGRTGTAWVPGRLHGAAATVGETGAATFKVTGTDADKAVTCKGDSGGPAVRTAADGSLTLAGLHHNSGQAGCYGIEGTSAESTETRVDDIAAWITQNSRSASCNAVGQAHGGNQLNRQFSLMDWNGDCKVDIMNVDTSGWLGAFRGTGDVSAPGRLFTNKQIVGSGWSPTTYPRVLTGDFNGDGLADIINQNPAGQLGAYEGTGTLQPQTMFPIRRMQNTAFTTSSYPGLLTGDFNGDGRTDIGARTADRRFLNIFLSTGDFSADNKLFSNQALVRLELLAEDGAAESTISDLLTGDVDGDGRSDVVGRNSDGKLLLWRSTGKLANSQIFHPRLLVGSGWTAAAYPRIFLGDWNADGRADIANQNASTGHVRGFVSTADVSAPGRLFTSGTLNSLALTTANYPRLITGDVDGDGRTDLIAQNTAGVLLLHRSTGTFTAESLFTKPGMSVGSGWTTTSYARIF